MTINEKIKKEIVSLLKKQKVVVEIADLEVPPSAGMGDLALPCFKLSKEYKRAPNEIAKDFAGNLKPAGLVIGYKNMGPYLNFILDSAKVAELVLKEISKSKSKYGQSKTGKGEKVMIEYSQPNTHKEFHIGHLRNVCIGAALINIYKNCGYKVVPANYIGDTGAHVAKTLWYLQNFINESDIPALPADRGEFLGECYVQANRELKDSDKEVLAQDKNLDKKEFSSLVKEEHKEYKQEVAEILKKLEEGDKELLKLWKETRQWSLDLFNQIYKELGVKFDVYFYESMEEKEGKKMLPKLLKYPFIKKSEGAIIADLEKFNLGILVLVRKDGTALYGIKDLPLAIKKFKQFKIKKSIYLIDVRQSQYFKQIFKILNLMGLKKEMIHVAYEFVQLKSGIISSRTGNVVTYQEVKEPALVKAVSETKLRHADWPEKKVNEVSAKIVQAALKFGMLKSGNDKVITFDIKEALDTNGFTGPYLQYTLARLNSILRKIGGISAFGGKVDYKNLGTSIEKQLIRDLANYAEIIAEALKNNDPSVFAQYLYKLAQNFNTFYHELPVLKAELGVQAARLVLIKSIAQVLENGLAVLGLPSLEEM